MTLRDLLVSLWLGLRLRCPHCAEGEMYKSSRQIHAECPKCKTPFERFGEGDYLGAITVAYAVTSVFIIALVFLLNAATGLALEAQLWIAALAGVAFLVIFYRNLRGLWVAVLVALLKWKR